MMMAMVDMGWFWSKPTLQKAMVMMAVVARQGSLKPKPGPFTRFGGAAPGVTGGVGNGGRDDGDGGPGALNHNILIQTSCKC